jgi:hypothetical protein
VTYHYISFPATPRPGCGHETLRSSIPMRFARDERRKTRDFRAQDARKPSRLVLV